MPRLREAELLRGKKALVIEDGPTLTHGEMRMARVSWQHVPRG
jgi:predicted GTPase